MMPVVLRTAECLLRSPDGADDLAQEAMIKALRAIDSYQEGTDIKAWLLTILRRTHIDWLRARRAKPVEQSLDAMAADEIADDSIPTGVHDEQWTAPEALLNRFEDATVIEALRSIPEDIRWTLLLVDVEQMEQAEAAGVLDVAVGTIKSRASRGRAMLRDRLYAEAQRRGWTNAEEPVS